MATLQNSGPISLRDIANEFRPGFSGSVSIEDYYRDGQFVPGSDDLPGVSEIQQVTATGFVSNTPNPGADRNQQYLATVAAGFSSADRTFSVAGSTPYPVASGTPAAEGVTLESGTGRINITNNSSGTLTDAFDGSVIVQITVAETTEPTRTIEVIKESTIDWTPMLPGRPFTAYVIGAGGSGGAMSSDAGREKVSSGGGAGGVAIRRFENSAASASIVVGLGGQSVSASGGGSTVAGFDGGASTLTVGNLVVTGQGGGRGFAGRHTTAAPSGINSSQTGSWGDAPASIPGSGVNGDTNFTGGFGPGIPNNVGRDGSGATGGGSVNFGNGVVAPGVSLNGRLISGSGFRTGVVTDRPVTPVAIPLIVTA